MGNMPHFQHKLFFQFVVFPAICVQFLVVFAAKKGQNAQTRKN